MYNILFIFLYYINKKLHIIFNSRPSYFPLNMLLVHSIEYMDIVHHLVLIQLTQNVSDVC